MSDIPDELHYTEEHEYVSTSADVRRIVGDGKMAAILALEGGFDTEGESAGINRRGVGDERAPRRKFSELR